MEGDIMKYKNIVVIGGGILGSQIAFQSAYCGFDVTILIREENSKEELLKKLDNLRNTYINEISIMSTKNGKDNWSRGISSIDDFDKKECINKANNAYESIKIETSQEKALKNADLVIESVTENIDVKAKLFEEISALLPEKTVIVTNSSTLLPSKLAKYTKREDKFLALHFANAI